MINKEKKATRIAKTNTEKKIFSLMGDLKRIRTSKNTITEKRKIKK